MRRIEDFVPGRFRAVCGVVGAAEDGGDYIHAVGPGGFATLERAQAAIAADKAYWAGDTGMGGLIARDGGKKRVYRVFEATAWKAVV